jgi:nucleotide-binding universal stress UspA family protein
MKNEIISATTPGTSLNPAETAPAPRAEPTELPIHLKKILTPIDFSDSSRKALKYASAFAAQFQATLLLLHVVEFSFIGSDFGLVELSQIEPDLKNNATQRLNEWRQKEVSQSMAAEVLVRSGRPYVEIVETAREASVDLILIASHGHSSLAHVLLGSTVERVVRHAPCLVLVVRPVEHEFVS